MSDTYEATFTWPAGPNEVIITGTFDNWSKSTKLVRSWEGSFSTTLKFPWGSRVLFKYVVDGQWVTSRHEKTETDPNGNVNNLFQVPPKPESTTLASVARTAVETQTAPAPSPKPQPVTDPSVKDTVVKTLTSVKNSALATEGVHPLTATSYVASAVGAAVATVTGVDPINAPKIPIDEPQAKPTTKTDLDLSPAAIHAAADGRKAVSARPIEGLPSLIPVASEHKVASPTSKETAPPKPTTPEPVSVPTATEPTPVHESTTAAKVPEPTKAVEKTKSTPEPSEAGSTLKEKVAYGADELGRNANSTPGSTLRSKKKRGSLLTRIKSVFQPDKEKEKTKK